MSDLPFRFDLYRINKISGDRDLFSKKLLTSDEDIEDVLDYATEPTIHYETETKSKDYRWDIREVKPIRTSKPRMLRFSLARTILREEGVSVTDTGLEDTISEPETPIGDWALVIIHMDRHLLLIERCKVTRDPQAAGAW